MQPGENLQRIHRKTVSDIGIHPQLPVSERAGQDGWRQTGETSGIPDPSCETMSFLSKVFVQPNVSSSRPRFQPKRGLAGIPARASWGRKRIRRARSGSGRGSGELDLDQEENQEGERFKAFCRTVGSVSGSTHYS